MSVDNRLAKRLALITGASGGIGSASARALWKRGMSLALTYHSNLSNITQLVTELKASQSPEQTISTHQVDLAKDESIITLFAEIQAKHSHMPDVAVINAGHARVIPDIQDISIEEFDTTIAVNLRASFILVQRSLPWMVQHGWGRVIFISSIAAEGGGINGCHYAASKAGLNGMMRNLADKLGKSGITVNSVAPAMIGDTGLIPDPSVLKGTPGDVVNIPVGRLGTPEECANVVEMICKTGYLTGQNILLTGGLK
ncbi:short chain dehydrogenase [Trichoderma velutinum]